MFTVLVTLTVRPDTVEEFLAGIRANAHASLRDEPGCLRFDVHRSVAEPNVFYVYELYADPDAFFLEHRAAPHYVTWRAVAERCIQPGGHLNTFAAPAFADDIPETAAHAASADSEVAGT
jgi:autoinducer 2-degrading protein